MTRHRPPHRRSNATNLAGSALAAGIVDRVAFFVAPKILGAGVAAIDTTDVHWVRGAPELGDFTARRIGDDWLLEGRLAVNESKRKSR